MRNITVAVPDEVYQSARVYAARKQTSVSAMVADFLFTIRHLARADQPVPPAQPSITTANSSSKTPAASISKPLASANSVPSPAN